MTISITPVYAGLLALFYVVLSMRVIRARRSAKVVLGDGGDEKLVRRQRVHGNFAEYVPIVLILMGLAELQARSDVIIHLIGSLLVIGRLLHAFGVDRPPYNFRFRIAGMVMTFAALITGGLINLGVISLLAALGIQ